MELTVGELQEMLKSYSSDTQVYFSGLDFYRLKIRGDNLVQVEFNQLVYKEKKTGKVIIENFD